MRYRAALPPSIQNLAKWSIWSFLKQLVPLYGLNVRDVGGRILNDLVVDVFGDAESLGNSTAKLHLPALFSSRNISSARFVVLAIGVAAIALEA
jgi:hypothetical protein